MLNISENNSIADRLELKEFESCKTLQKNNAKPLHRNLLIIVLTLILGAIFLPWTQNISAKGNVTTRLPEQRPQAIQSVIAGRLEKWYVREGDLVQKGDTIAFLSEIKSEYFDPNLIARTSDQVEAKNQSVVSYDQKVVALEKQYEALEYALKLKLEQIQNKLFQAKNKIRIDSIDLEAYRINLKIAQNQLKRTQELHKKGLKTLTELQEKQLKLQQVKAKVTVQENKLQIERNEFGNLKIEIVGVQKEYADKLAKSESEKQSALSAKLESVAATAKLRNQLSNYQQRQKYYHIIAPQSGYITQTTKAGLGETIKSGASIATIMPLKYDLAVEVFLRPQDLPLMHLEDRARLRFDGWPAIVISGWPKASTGIFSGRIVAIDRFVNKQGFYRVLISPDKEEKKWPERLRVGTGVKSFIMLKEVSVWYELWRQLNGFPPDFYQTSIEEKQQKAKK